MTFEEYCAAMPHGRCIHAGAARDAWDVATKVERERIRAIFDSDYTFTMPDGRTIKMVGMCEAFLKAIDGDMSLTKVSPRFEIGQEGGDER